MLVGFCSLGSCFPPPGTFLLADSMTDSHPPVKPSESDPAPPALDSALSPPAPKLGGGRRAVLRGLGVVLPPLLTIVVLIWAWNAIETYVLKPTEEGVRWLVVWKNADILDRVPAEATEVEFAVPEGKKPQSFLYKEEHYVLDPARRRYLPGHVVTEVDEKIDFFGSAAPAPRTANEYWDRYIRLLSPPRWIVVPFFLVVFISVLFFLGRYFTGGIGRWILATFDATILRIPIVNKVYGSVKQITDFAVDERQIEFNRVVAIQYPGEGIWSIGFVTGNSMKEISEATGEPMLSVLMPTSPMPMTGFTVTIRRKDAIDLDLTVDEAIQFVVSCGVVVPSQQRVPKPAKNGPGKLLGVPPTPSIKQTV